MTFIELINYAHNKYKTKNNLVIFELIYWLSKKVKSKEDFVRYRNTCIDFAKTIFNKLLNDYFIKQKPLSQITNTTKFYGLTIKVNHQIFEPRSETEDLVELTIKTLKNNKRLISGADLCCGTGCIGIAIKKHCPWVNITSVDINKKAIINTKENAKLNKVNIKTYVGDFYKILIQKNLKFDFIVCNPPYVSNKTLNKATIKYETKISFVNSKDPMFFYKTLIHNESKLINKNGFLAFEMPNAIPKVFKFDN